MRIWKPSTLAVVGVLLCVTTAIAEESRLDTVLNRDKLIVGTYSTSPPLAFADKDGKLTGWEVDFARMIAKDLLGDPNKIEFVVFTADGRFPAVLSGKIDFGIASTTIFPERAVRVAFTTPYMDSGVAVLIRKDSNIKTLKDLDDEKISVAGLTTPTNIERAKRYFPKAHTLSLETPSAMFLAVKSGQAQAMQIDLPIADYYAQQNSDLAVLPSLIGDLTNNAIFVKPGDFTWWLFLDTTVREYRYGARYGEYRELFQKWFGKDPPAQRFYSGGQGAKQ